MASEKSIKEFEEVKTNKLSVEEEVQRRTAELRLAVPERDQGEAY